MQRAGLGLELRRNTRNTRNTQNTHNTRSKRNFGRRPDSNSEMGPAWTMTRIRARIAGLAVVPEPALHTRTASELDTHDNDSLER